MTQSLFSDPRYEAQIGKEKIKFGINTFLSVSSGIATAYIVDKVAPRSISIASGICPASITTFIMASVKMTSNLDSIFTQQTNDTVPTSEDKNIQPSSSVENTK